MHQTSSSHLVSQHLHGLHIATLKRSNFHIALHLSHWNGMRDFQPPRSQMINLMRRMEQFDLIRMTHSVHTKSVQSQVATSKFISDESTLVSLMDNSWIVLVKKRPCLLLHCVLTLITTSQNKGLKVKNTLMSFYFDVSHPWTWRRNRVLLCHQSKRPQHH